VVFGAGPSSRAVYCLGLRPLACWDRGFESHRGHECFSVVKCYVLSGRGFYDELITRPEESYRLWCVVVCDQEISRMRRPWPALGRRATENKQNKVVFGCVLLSKWRWKFWFHERRNFVSRLTTFQPSHYLNVWSNPTSSTNVKNEWDFTSIPHTPSWHTERWRSCDCNVPVTQLY